MKTIEMVMKIPEVTGGRCIKAELIRQGILFEILLTFEMEDNDSEEDSEEDEGFFEEDDDNEWDNSSEEKKQGEAISENKMTKEETPALKESGEAKKENTAIPESKWECRIDPSLFEGEWMEYTPTTIVQKELLKVYQKAKEQGDLHAFTCMGISPSIEDRKDRKIVYQKGLPPAFGYRKKEWKEILKNYNPARNSRMMTKAEYVCVNLFIIQKLIEFGCDIKTAWAAVESKEIVYSNGLRKLLEKCGFYNLFDTYKILEKDSWDKQKDRFWQGGGQFSIAQMTDLYQENYDYGLSVGMLAMD